MGPDPTSHWVAVSDFAYIEGRRKNIPKRGGLLLAYQCGKPNRGTYQNAPTIEGDVTITNLGSQSSTNGLELDPINILGSSWRRKGGDYGVKGERVGVTLCARTSEIPNWTNICARCGIDEEMRAQERVTAHVVANIFVDTCWRQFPSNIGNILDIVEDGRGLGQAR
jgi:hypothetical protein